MHEASLVQGLLKIVLQTVAEKNAALPGEKQITRVREIICELGLFSCVEPRTLTSCFELFAEGTLAEGAELTLKRTPLSCTCLACNHAFTADTRQFHCPECGSDNIQFDGGHGLMLCSLRVDTEEEDNARTRSG